MFYKRNLIGVGLLLLLIFILAVWLVGMGIDRTANRMHHSMIEEIGRYRSDLIALDFHKTIGMSESVRQYWKENPDDEKGLQNLLCGMVRLDTKVTRIWYSNSRNELVCIDSLGLQKTDPLLETKLKKFVTDGGKREQSRFYYNDGILYWTLFWKLSDITYGFDISLAGLHAYFAGMSPAVKSYAFVVNSRGMLIVHPDEKQIGRTVAVPEVNQQLKETFISNKILHGTGFSQYLLIPVERVYYPIRVGNEKWVVVVNVPDFITREEMAGFHRYTLIIALLTLVLFSILLAYSQYRWRKEYDRRQQLEQETLQLNLQQLRNQVNPHFLFNALNSLSALITTEPVLAKEFVLKLSKIYRYVLENRNESLLAVSEELQFIRLYYFLQKIRFREQLELEVAEGLEQEKRKIPFMSLQMLIENAIKHNEITRQYPLKIHIYAEGNNLIVANTYRPRTDTEDSLGMGFESISKIYTYCSTKQFEYKIVEGKFICFLPLL